MALSDNQNDPHAPNDYHAPIVISPPRYLSPDNYPRIDGWATPLDVWSDTNDHMDSEGLRLNAKKYDSERILPELRLCKTWNGDQVYHKVMDIVEMSKL